MSPQSTKRHCIIWEMAAITLLVFIATYAIIGRVLDVSLTKEIVMSIGATFSVMWCIWVVRTFRSIMNWWIHMHQQLEAVTGLLHETKKDLSEIKSNIK